MRMILIPQPSAITANVDTESLSDLHMYTDCDTVTVTCAESEIEIENEQILLSVQI